MKRIFQLCFTLAIFSAGFSQNLKPVAQKVKNSQTAKKTFVKYDLFTADRSSQKQAMYKAAAEDITVMQLNKSEVQRINTERPEALEMSFPFEGQNLTLELVRNNFLTNDFSVTTDKGAANYTPGVYYYGIVKGDYESLVAISFFKDQVMGVTSIKDVGNVVLGKANNSDDYVSYNDFKLKGTNPFACGADDLPENKTAAPSFDPETMTAAMTTNCVRVYYEVGYGPYTQNGSNVTTTTNWVTAMHNNISTLYANDGMTMSLSNVMVWTTTDPYTGQPNQILAQFRSTRPTFNGDIGQLVRNPATTSIAYLDTLCTGSNHSYSGVNQFYSNVPTYSWNIMAMAHEMGHNLGSPHTHACRWNGNNTAIDGCGPAAGADEGCTAPLPAKGGTIMSYCHLVSSVGVNFLNGFGPQPGALIRSRINSSACLGTDCVNPCAVTATGLTVNSVTTNSATATISDATGTSWRYVLSKTDGTVITSAVTTNKVLNLTNLTPGSFYFLSIGPECTGPEAYQFRQLIFTDADWCSGTLFTDSGGETGNYTDGENWVKTFYPNNPTDKLKLTFTEFNTEPASDYMIVYNGPSVASPRFPGPATQSGTTIPGPYQSTHATGAITVRFISNGSGNQTGWKGNFECITLGTKESSAMNDVNIYPNTTKGTFTISSKDKILSYQVFDSSGKSVSVSNQLSSSKEILDLSKLPAGTYLVQVKTANATVSKKVIK
ncbi:M12 family metallo-peptidase [Chryseobacterium suipulveris]|uniref:M12 family metallo-peptidase n=1 Tax=Chryseobacterium suipulveris TaxID=2929800 RepID=A0ABY4BS76_9FLAO|nr:M12 family metallo-peptidase [Chryseobacterium suipulveris]UOE42049.1 M12 family metallo-peptidase [Chryseobacterium suipulveris]